MSNRTWIGAGVIAMLIGCRATGHPGPSRAEALSPLDEAAAPGTPPPRAGGFAAMPRDAGTDNLVCPEGQVVICTDPYNCTCGNGTGVYAVEGGYAGIGVLVDPSEHQTGLTEQIIMITHFINNTSTSNVSYVTFAYGYFVLSANQLQWKPLGIGRVDSADYVPPTSPSTSQYNLPVISVRETGTAPIWLLRTPGSKAPWPVQDPLSLKLHISFTVPGSVAPKHVILDFDATGTNKTGGNVKQTLNEYRMQWRNLTDFPTGTPPQPYCHGSSKQPDDMAVFQQGIDVDPLTGTVKHPNPALNPDPANVVTVSCSLGALAMVYSWRYPYQGSDTDTFYFDAGIHMKRASYCGDSRYYTVAGTTINIYDSIPAHLLSIPAVVEAWWDRRGAVCVNSEHMRHPEMAPTDIELMTCGGKPYNGQPQQLPSCSFICNSKPLPPCPPGPPPPQLLIDGP